RRTVAGRLGARRTAAMRTVALRTVALRTAAGRTAARPPGSGPGGEPPGRGGAAAGAGNELERHLIAWLDAVEKGHLVEALSLAEDVPGEAGPGCGSSAKRGTAGCWTCRRRCPGPSSKAPARSS